jgi:hypothetical protein
MISSEFFDRVWEMLIGRTDGPLTFRLLVQPAVATIFAIRAGLKDARENRSPYLWSIFVNPAHRSELVRQGWKDVSTLFVVAILLDVIYELIMFRWVYPLQALLVATVLAIVPYLLVRGPFTRVLRRLQRP